MFKFTFVRLMRPSFSHIRRCRYTRTLRQSERLKKLFLSCRENFLTRNYHCTYDHDQFYISNGHECLVHFLRGGAASGKNGFNRGHVIPISIRRTQRKEKAGESKHHAGLERREYFS